MENYSQYLSDSWLRFKSPRQTDSPSVISLFAGCGGSSLGYGMAGFRELLAVESDDHAVACLRNNFEGLNIYQGDINNLKIEYLFSINGVRHKEVDVLDGSPPCQGFSMMGRREFTDSRNQLFRQYVRILRALQPKVLIMENVAGMVRGGMKLIFTEIIRELRDSGYNVKAWLLNAMHYRVPQSRERIIFIGIRDDFGLTPSYPRPYHRMISCLEGLSGIRQGIEGIGGIRQGFGPTKIKNDDFCNKWRSVNLPCVTIVKARPPIFKLRDGTQREMTIDEASILSSFPREYKFIGSNRQIINRIGNSVPPLFMEAIADHVKSTILDQINAKNSN